MNCQKKGFTLIELLIVMAILFFILSLLLVTGIKIRKQALTISCRMNMHQVSKGFFLYMIDNHGYFPHSDRDSDTGINNCWFDVLDDYLHVGNLHTIKQCPEWAGYGGLKNTTDEHSIKMNGALCNQERPESDNKVNTYYLPNIYNIKQKSQTVLLLDGTTEFPLNRHTDTRIEKPYYDIANRHNGANLLFVSGASVSVKVNKGNIVGWENDMGFIWNPYELEQK